MQKALDAAFQHIRQPTYREEELRVLEPGTAKAKRVCKAGSENLVAYTFLKNLYNFFFKVQGSIHILKNIQKY